MERRTGRRKKGVGIGGISTQDSLRIVNAAASTFWLAVITALASEMVHYYLFQHAFTSVNAALLPAARIQLDVSTAVSVSK
jgi:hypothetical protein